ncbi:HAD-IA family hydrolase [Winogradskya humida]|uniref:Hydrolase n=1 Tax=Winogradskya humida TaxID=113566 RepID=A0ABQ3ZIJ8_9ACTN|nr:HAD-IA family hydrolase [Actinoplanes humidus]GIE18409.1 hydrolase [Actinoplanes humidus]
MTHLLMDFGNVISADQSRSDLMSMALAAGIPMPEFIERYWESRPEYDRGLSALAYWTDVLGTPPGGQRLCHLVERDVSSWLHLNQDTMSMLDDVHAAGVPVSLLSNAPRELARELDRHAALKPFAHRLYSADLEMIKPDPAIYTHAVAVLGAEPADVIFVDDRLDNIEAAKAVGLRAIHFTGMPECHTAIREAALGLKTVTA